MQLSVEQFFELVKVLGLAVGGLWVAWTFHKLQRARAAEIDNNLKLIQTQKERIEQEEVRTRLFRQQPQLAIQIKTVEMVPFTQNSESFLGITVVLKNEGEQNLRVDFDSSALTVGRIVLTETGMQKMEEVARFGPSYFVPESDVPQMLPYRILRAGQSRQMALAVLPVTESAAYLIQFHAVYGRVAFDGQSPSSEKSFLIDAMEQRFWMLTKVLTKKQGAPSSDR